MGHNMGMLHDFDEDHGGSNGPCDGTGIMSYGSAPNVWSTCSRADFLALYNQIIASSSWNWCLAGKIKKLLSISFQIQNENWIQNLILIEDATACGGTAPPPGPTTTTAAPPPPTG